MAHKSIISCDRCGTEEHTKHGPFPEGWVHLAITVHHPEAMASARTEKTEMDLCPICIHENQLGEKNALGTQKQTS